MNRSPVVLKSGSELHTGPESEVKLVGLVSDTHISSEALELPQGIMDAFKEASVIIHAGDLVSLKVVEYLEKIAPVVAVHGNMDPQDVRMRFPAMNSTVVFNWKIGVVHDAGALWGKRGMRRIAQENGFDVLVFGHTHRAFLETGPVVFINPGSPTEPFPPYLVKPSVGLLKVAPERIEPSIVEL